MHGRTPTLARSGHEAFGFCAGYAIAPHVHGMYLGTGRHVRALGEQWPPHVHTPAAAASGALRVCAVRTPAAAADAGVRVAVAEARHQLLRKHCVEH